MRKRIQIALAILLTFIAGALAWHTLGVQEPRYQGKTVSSWLADLDPGNPHSSDTAMQAVRVIGTNSFPWLTKMVRATDPPWKRKVIVFNAKQPFIRIPVMPASIVRARAVAGYAALGGAAKDNVPALVQIMESETSPQVRCCVASALGGIGPSAKSAIPVLLRAAQDPDPQVRKDAILALANIRSWAEPPGGDELR